MGEAMNASRPDDPDEQRRNRRVVPFVTAMVALGALVAAGWLVRADIVGGTDPRGGEPVLNEATGVQAGITVTPAAIDIGDVFMDVTEVPMEFVLTNTGDRVAVVTYLETSCDCTTAAVVVDGREGPRFAMRHGTPPGTFDWRAVLAPGEATTLKVYYNPQAHGVASPAEAPAIHGPAVRFVRVHSDDASEQSFVDLRIDLNQRH
jgi:hypothetical protein